MRPWKHAVAPDNKHFKANSHFLFFIPIQYTPHLPFSQPLLEHSSSCILTCCDWLTCMLRTENGYNFSHQVMGHQDQYSHCWLSFCNLYNIGSDRSLSCNCLHFQIKLVLFFRPFSTHGDIWNVCRPCCVTHWEAEGKGHKKPWFISMLHLLSTSPSLPMLKTCGGESRAMLYFHIKRPIIIGGEDGCFSYQRKW